MAECLEERPDQTALELLVEFQARCRGQYSLRQLHTLLKRVRAWQRRATSGGEIQGWRRNATVSQSFPAWNPWSSGKHANSKIERAL
jgi:hypothetical protein